MKFNKSIFNCFFLFFFLNSFLYPDSFTNIIQDLAMQTACIGQYSATQAGGGWNDDPHDYYTPKMLAERFKKMSGDMTRTATFYGVCFDYAQFAWDDIKKYQSSYNKAGMVNQEWYLVYVASDSNKLQLEDPVSAEKADVIHNGISLKKKYEKNVKAHKGLNGVRATYHEWLWIQRSDGVWFWIDPTWTDNLGYVVYGYVANGEEIQLRPDEKFCINYPSYLYNLPLPPEMKKNTQPKKEQEQQIVQVQPQEIEENHPVPQNNDFVLGEGYGIGFYLNSKGQYGGILLDFCYFERDSTYLSTKLNFIHKNGFGFAGLGIGIDYGVTSRYVDVFCGGDINLLWTDPYIDAQIEAGIQFDFPFFMLKTCIIYSPFTKIYEDINSDVPLKFAFTLLF